jgi:hypothetical protein
MRCDKGTSIYNLQFHEIPPTPISIHHVCLHAGIVRVAGVIAQGVIPHNQLDTNSFHHRKHRLVKDVREGFFEVAVMTWRNNWDESRKKGKLLGFPCMQGLRTDQDKSLSFTCRDR